MWNSGGHAIEPGPFEQPTQANVGLVEIADHEEAVRANDGGRLSERRRRRPLDQPQLTNDAALHMLSRLLQASDDPRAAGGMREARQRHGHDHRQAPLAVSTESLESFQEARDIDAQQVCGREPGEFRWRSCRPDLTWATQFVSRRPLGRFSRSWKMGSGRVVTCTPTP